VTALLQCPHPFTARKRLFMLRRKLPTIWFTRKLICVLLLSLTVSFIGWRAQAGRWLSNTKAASRAAVTAKASTRPANPLREVIARKLQTQANVKVDEDMRRTGMAESFPDPYFDSVVTRAANYRSRVWSTVAASGRTGAGQQIGETFRIPAIAAGYAFNLALKNDGTVIAWGSNNFGQATVPANLSGVTAVAAGAYHGLALKRDGTVVAWGFNNNGQTNVPANLSGVTAIAAGGYHNLALKSDGTIVAWGRNDYGQANVPANLSGVTAIAAGLFHSLALKSDGTVVAWGHNTFGQTNVPANLSGVMAIAAGSDHSLALKSDGTVIAWGYNGYGQTSVPANLSAVTAIAAGYFHSLALKSDGTVVAWGFNDNGQTNVPAALTTGSNRVVAWGLNDNGQANVPANLSGVTAIAAGNGHSLALKSDGTVVAWGFNHFGQANVPANLSGVTAIAAGGTHSLALKSEGSVVAWGSNSAGQRTVPAGLSGVTAIVAGASHNLALKSDGTVVAWGWNNFGEATVPANLSGVAAIAAGNGHSLALKSDGTVVAWGWNFAGQTNVPANLSGVAAIAAGYLYSLALKSDGTVVAWGLNNNGQTTVPANLSGVTAIAAGGHHSLALKSDGTVVAWGFNDNGQTNVPANLNGVTTIAAGGSHSLALCVGNAPPTIAAINVTRTAASPSSNSQIATVNDTQDASTALQVNASLQSGSGVTVSNISVDANGNVTADVQAVCGTTDSTFTLTVTDSGSLFATAQLLVTVSANTPPTLTYPSNPGTVYGTGITVSPLTGPSDNGSVSSVQVYSVVPPVNSGISVDSTGVVTIAGTVPAGSYTITIRATDNCGAPTDASFTLTITCPSFASSAPTATGALGTSYSSAVAATPAALSGLNYRYSLVNGTNLPARLSLNATTGAITGTPTAPGQVNFAIKVELFNGATTTGCAVTQSFSINIACVSNPVVTTNAESGTGSLRDAIALACPGSSITFVSPLFDAAQTINLNSQLVIDKNLSITGKGAKLLTLNSAEAAGPDSRVFLINSGRTADLSGMTITGGEVSYNDSNGSAEGGGGGLRNHGTLTLTGCAVSGNLTSYTGAQGGVAGGGSGIRNQGSLTVINSTLAGNTANRGIGAGIFNFGTVNIVNSTLSGNTANGPTGGGPGGIFNAGSLTVTNSTISGNTTSGVGGGIQSSGGTTKLRNTLVAGNTAALGSDVFGPLISLGHNLIGNTSGATVTAQSGDKFDAAAAPLNLGPLADNGGPTPTHALLPGSVAINAGNNCVLTANGCAANDPPTALATDQRGTNFPRQVGGQVDIGAFEANYALVATGGTLQNATVNTTFVSALQATLTESYQPVSGVQISFSVPSNGASASLSSNTATTNSAGQASVNVKANNTAGTYNVTASANGAASVNFTLTNIAPPAITKSFSPATINPGGVSQLTLNFTSVAGNVALNNLALTDNLPQGMTVAATPGLNNTCGFTVSGATPGSKALSLTGGGLMVGPSSCQVQINVTSTTLGAAQNTTGSVSATGNGVSLTGNQATATLQVSCPNITVNPATVPNGGVGLAYPATNFTATGSTAPHNFTRSGTLPAGLNFTGGASAQLTGTPSEGGTFNFTITAESFGCSGKRDYTLVINRPPILAALGNKAVAPGQLLSFTASASDPDTANTLSFSLAGAPAGALINPMTGQFSWTPTQAQLGLHSFNVVVTDNGNPALSHSQPLVVNVGNLTPALTLSVAFVNTNPANIGLSAQLRDSVTNTAIPAKLINFNIGTKTVTGTTDGNGVALGQISVAAPGAYAAKATFAGEAAYPLAMTVTSFNVTQGGQSCAFTRAPASQSFAANGGTGTVQLTTQASNCNWSAASAVPWITLTSGLGGTGNGTVGYTVAANPEATPRSGTINLAGLSFRVVQGGIFNDVPVGHPFYAEIGRLAARGVTLGCGGGNYCPDATVTREQMAAFIMRSLGEFNPPAPATQRFLDVPPANPFYACIEQMAVRGITQGCGGGNYCPMGQVTREAMAAFLIRALHVPGYVPPTPAMQRFLDVPPASPFYGFIDEMATRGITLGCGGGNYCPTALVTRAQMAVFLVRAFGL
jgi:alpha-tubulin suppressor-like RCC1 family protein